VSLAALRPRVIDEIRDDNAVIVNPAGLNQLIADAVVLYSTTRPRQVVADIAGTGAFDYALPAGWVDGWSKLLLVEYPAGQREPEFVDPLDWEIYRSPSGAVLRFKADTPLAGKTIRVTFTAQHTVAESTTSVPTADFTGLVYLAAAAGCEQLASRYANQASSTMMADSVDQNPLSKQYSERAKRYRTLAQSLVPVQEQTSEVAPAGGQTSWADESFPLSHPQR
jgi:hypothetical protein